MLVSVTRMRLKSWAARPAFQLAVLRIVGQLGGQGGFRAGRATGTPGQVFWTVTTWEDATSANVFRDQPPHRNSKRKSAEWTDELATTRWHAPDGPVPPWPECVDRLVAAPTFYSLPSPSPDHAAQRIVAPAAWPGGGFSFQRGAAAMAMGWLPFLVPVAVVVGVIVWLAMRG